MITHSLPFQHTTSGPIEIGKKRGQNLLPFYPFISSLILVTMVVMLVFVANYSLWVILLIWPLIMPVMLLRKLESRDYATKNIRDYAGVYAEDRRLCWWWPAAGLQGRRRGEGEGETLTQDMSSSDSDATWHH